MLLEPAKGTGVERMATPAQRHQGVPIEQEYQESPSIRFLTRATVALGRIGSGATSNSQIPCTLFHADFDLPGLAHAKLYQVRYRIALPHGTSGSISGCCLEGGVFRIQCGAHGMQIRDLKRFSYVNIKTRMVQLQHARAPQ